MNEIKLPIRDGGDTSILDANGKQIAFAVFDEMPALVNAVNEHETLTAKIEQQDAEIEWLTNALRRVYSTGHNLDCIYCGHKDKHVLDTLRPKENTDA